MRTASEVTAQARRTSRIQTSTAVRGTCSSF